MNEKSSQLDIDCLLNTLYVVGSYLIACPHTQLHLAPSYVVPTDLRLHDYAQRYQLDLTCLIQVVRTVYAAQHTAHHYHTWSLKHSSTDVRAFARDAFHIDQNVREVEDMIRDGHRLLQLEHSCQNSYMCFVVALDWRRFEATSDDLLLELTRDLLARPAVQGLVTFLVPRWMYNSFHYYHGQLNHYCSLLRLISQIEQLLEFRLGPVQNRQVLIRESVQRCPGCSLFLQQDIYQSRSCVGCRRGGFVCRSRLPGLAEPTFWDSATRLTRQVASKCDHLSSTLGGQAHSRVVVPMEPPTDGASSNESLVLNVLAQVDQKLEHLCQQELFACDACRRRKTRCSLKLVKNSALQRRTRRTVHSLPPLLEGDEALPESKPPIVAG